MDGNEIDDETISGENDVEYAEFSMAHRMPSSQGSIINGVGGAGNSETNALDEELILLSLFDDSTSSNTSNRLTVHDSTGPSSGHSCKLSKNIKIIHTNMNVFISCPKFI